MVNARTALPQDHFRRGDTPRERRILPREDLKPKRSESAPRAQKDTKLSAGSLDTFVDVMSENCRAGEPKIMH